MCGRSESQYHETDITKEPSTSFMSDSIPSKPRPVLKLKIAASSSSDRGVRQISGATPSPSLPPQRAAIHAPLRSGSDSSPGVRRHAAHPVAKPARPQSKPSQKPVAAWSDEFKRQMQEDMDALLTR
jgi:hypothetical protein